MLMGPVAAQAPVAAGAAVGHGLRRQWPEESQRGQDLLCGGGPRWASGVAGLGPRVGRWCAPRFQPWGQAWIPVSRESMATGFRDKTRCLTVPPAPGNREAGSRSPGPMCSQEFFLRAVSLRTGGFSSPLGLARLPELEGRPHPPPSSGTTPSSRWPRAASCGHQQEGAGWCWKQERGLGSGGGPRAGGGSGLSRGAGGSARTCSSSRWICSVSSWTPGCGAFSSRPGGAENTSSFRGPL